MSSVIFLFGASLYLLQPMALLFGMAAAIPIVIHFWSRHRHQPMEWAATHYLQLAMQKASAAITFQQLLLLCVRVLVIVVLAIALAGPYSKDGFGLLKGNTPKSILHVLIVDRSFSMQLVQNEKSRLDLAKSIALSIVQDANQGDGFLLFAADAKLIAYIGEPVAEKDIVSSEIELISPSNTVLAPAEIFRQLSELPAINNSSLFDEKRIHVLSDYSAVDWMSADDEPDYDRSTGRFSEFKDLFLSLASVQYHLIPSAPASNNFVSDIQIERSELLVSKPLQFKVELENSQSFGMDGIEDNGDVEDLTQKEPVLVELLIDNETVGSKTVVIPLNGKVSVPFETRISRVGELQVEARICNDALPVDNRRYKIVETLEKQSVLFIESNRRSSRFLQFALEPNEMARSDFRFVVVDPKSLVDEDLEKFQFIFLDNVRALSEADVIRLRRYSTSGGSIAMFLGDQVDRADFNEKWRKKVDDLPILPVELLGVVDVANYRIDTLEYLSPLLLSFRGNEDSGLTNLPIWSYYQSKIDDPSLARVDLALQNGDPLLVTCKLGDGQCILFTSSSSSLSRSNNPEKTSWNANEAWPTFPPLIQEIYQSGTRFSSTRSFQVGDAIFGEFESDSLVDELSVRYANGDTIDAQWQQNNGVVTWTTDPVDRPGIVSVDSKSRAEELTQKFSVNVATRESRLESLSPNNDLFTESDFSGSTLPSPSQFQGYQLLLVLLFGLLLLETILSQRFGRAR